MPLAKWQKVVYFLDQYTNLFADYLKEHQQWESIRMVLTFT